ncbi:MAG: hypothetical protein ACLRSD_02100 [Oscillibacter sp.]
MTDGPGRFLQRWQERKRETLTIRFWARKIPWGLVPYLQALLARYLRGIWTVPPFLWK